MDKKVGDFKLHCKLAIQRTIGAGGLGFRSKIIFVNVTCLSFAVEAAANKIVCMPRQSSYFKIN